MTFLEKNLEDIIFHNFEACNERGLNICWSSFENTFRQLRLDPYGVADIVIFDYDTKSYCHTITIIECKKDKIDYSAYAQAKRYETAIRTAFIKKGIKESQLIFNVLLIGSSIDKQGDFVFVINGDPSLYVYEYSYEIDGIHFQQDHKAWVMGDTKSYNPSFIKHVLDYTKSLQDQEDHRLKYNEESKSDAKMVTLNNDQPPF